MRSAAAVVSHRSLRHPRGHKATVVWEASRCRPSVHGTGSFGPSDVLGGHHFTPVFLSALSVLQEVFDSSLCLCFDRLCMNS